MCAWGGYRHRDLMRDLSPFSGGAWRTAPSLPHAFLSHTGSHTPPGTRARAAHNLAQSRTACELATATCWWGNAGVGARPQLQPSGHVDLAELLDFTVVGGVLTARYRPPPGAPCSGREGWLCEYMVQHELHLRYRLRKKIGRIRTACAARDTVAPVTPLH